MGTQKLALAAHLLLQLSTSRCAPLRNDRNGKPIGDNVLTRTLALEMQLKNQETQSKAQEAERLKQAAKVLELEDRLKVAERGPSGLPLGIFGGHYGGCACATEALRAAYAMEMRSSEGRVLETADAFLDDKADRLWRTRSAALRELAQKVRDGTDLVLLCAGRIESCHGDLLRKGILAEAAQLEATSKRKPRSDKGKPRGPRGPRADSPEAA
ncbi:hypothetical protein EMIHUDRAFT_251008 [Emiliania huxleyi CCMP1516]|uniref:Uncharacterized protein n=2 Tax=Emiliania huxleyi TaxID=2903 RepID=A0A0D3KYG8_EMIH1|nr:hypothetical protein EMIHUDRAFT_251008 [Emiliania huxleyi CCMP1516]EOD40803.1 hypothetical protein EMIHUDRAFT_251008 [Emiliania huxleyi CCMP1516]|eukprot:XP_005793232.1 hypothetical protein EMIHUDRAFT_251008 [Emiliania huxleyi CCMP1516]